MATSNEERATSIIEAVRTRGNEPVGCDLRDAAHEAFHAMTAGAKSWKRETVHRALVKKIRQPAKLWIHEMHARAVEQVVCARLGVDCGTLDGWVFTSCMEAIKSGMPSAEPTISTKIAADYMTTAECSKWADRIIALGDA